MGKKVILVGGIAAIGGVCLAVAMTGAALAQTKPRADDYRLQVAEVAKLSYTKLRMAREQNPHTISADDLSRASLEWFKAEVATVKSKTAALRVASDYLEREGVYYPRP